MPPNPDEWFPLGGGVVARMRDEPDMSLVVIESFIPAHPDVVLDSALINADHAHVVRVAIDRQVKELGDAPDKILNISRLIALGDLQLATARGPRPEVCPNGHPTAYRVGIWACCAECTGHLRYPCDTCGAWTYRPDFGPDCIRPAP
ncbi:hypothetical protein GCM10023215_67190 [Pseudonocardia yuanmonensis]|uniref:Uncharacterized protein n=1 Tax=Pseudonocardia yuanmonensis TaxID=1095914 RepID=A0ABP8XW39_9PSEU